MYNDRPIPAQEPTIMTYPQTTAQRRGITLPPVSSCPIPRSESLFRSGRTHSLETDSPSSTTTALLGARSPRRHRSLLHPRTKARSASINSSRSRKSVASSAPQSPCSRTSLSPKRTRIFGRFGMAALIGPLKSLNFKRLILNRGGSKQKAKQKMTQGPAGYGGDLDSGKGLTENMAFYDIDVDMDSQPLSARSFMETDMELMSIDSPTTQFAAYAPCPDDSDPFATPQPSATMSVDSSPMSSITNNYSGKCSVSALRSRLKTLQMLGPEASDAIAMKYGKENNYIT